jgi:dephospho-CoA kinase
MSQGVAMKLIGLTGGIGSGKSTVGRLLGELGAVVCDVDVIARDVLAAGQPALQEVRQHFGADVFHADGTLNRAALASIVFPDPDALAVLEEITHPHIARQLETWIATMSAEVTTGTLVVVDHPLLIETQDLTRYDAIVVVTCDDAVRRKRLVTSRGLSLADVEARIAAQSDDDIRRQHATHVIDNSGDENLLRAAVQRLFFVLTTDHQDPIR